MPLFNPLRGQPAFRVECRHTARSGGRDCLTVIIVGDVSRGKHAVDRGVRAKGLSQANIAFVVHF